MTSNVEGASLLKFGKATEEIVGKFLNSVAAI
ncbi:hypothetical protein FOXG_18325 [Fusarium oxysporum f. sp. lycopersici 4287]|uniref:Uncharacterized protein n=1 Tax=Fusarium oxysporum f. sp. lycopersici (strain 4287 / CBS 123668 / FGSC 9935 / NRRL 34936) TaxID=426428 RepID=A0A0J9UF52_FUSO4|nr:hypothetical protein FOXG_18325 [Fusarium oxysporum f. sp. lycopersici 4287]KNA98038.1 hypothetical protein FOXG_18325 [Fusarium oxysporum f. sp. lycopersici 4287]